MRYSEACGCDTKKKKKESKRELPKAGEYTSKELEKSKQGNWRK